MTEYSLPPQPAFGTMLTDGTDTYQHNSYGPKPWQKFNYPHTQYDWASLLALGKPLTTRLSEPECYIRYYTEAGFQYLAAVRRDRYTATKVLRDIMTAQLKVPGRELSYFDHELLEIETEDHTHTWKVEVE